jgi:hypothetical protein
LGSMQRAVRFPDDLDARMVAFVDADPELDLAAFIRTAVRFYLDSKTSAATVDRHPPKPSQGGTVDRPRVGHGSGGRTTVTPIVKGKP